MYRSGFKIAAMAQIAAVALGVAGCAQRPQGTSSFDAKEKQILAENQARSDRAARAIDAALAPGVGCNDPKVDSAIDGLATLRAHLDSLDMSTVYVTPSALAGAEAGYLTLRLTLADRAKAKGCLDLADQQYRSVVAAYSGSRQWAGYWERARMGVEDVRDARRATPAKR